ncbi:MAG: hypothetical protein AB7S72_17260 [Draconibacterium sp.]
MKKRKNPSPDKSGSPFPKGDFGIGNCCENLEEKDKKEVLRNEISLNNTGLSDEFVGWRAGDFGAE